jgi:transcriptional regulator with XRE-family HTH domain
MGRDIEDIIDSLPQGRRDKVNARAGKLAVEMIGRADSLAELRTFSGVTQQELGDALGVNQGAVSQMEKRSDVYLSTLRKVVVALGWELEVALKSSDGKRVALPNFQPWTTVEVPVKAKAADPGRAKAVPVKAPKRKSHTAFEAEAAVVRASARAARAV